MNDRKRLYRSNRERMIAGVCGGLGEYFGIDPTIIRLAWVAVTLCGNVPGIVAYLIAAIVIPQSPYV